MFELPKGFGPGELPTDKTCLSYWFPILEAAGIPVPKTRILRTELPLINLADGEPLEGFMGFIDELGAITDEMGYPCFLRTGHGSGKHEWKHTCFLTSRDRLPFNVSRLIEWSCTVDLWGLPLKVWVVREMLPVRPIATLPVYGDMPLVREIRAFIHGGKIIGWHPYWPPEPVTDGFAYGQEPSAEASKAAEEVQKVDWATARPLALRCAELFKDDEAFSVDLLETDRGWYVTDMALKARSFHWDEGMREDSNG